MCPKLQRALQDEEDDEPSFLDEDDDESPSAEPSDDGDAGALREESDANAMALQKWSRMGQWKGSSQRQPQRSEDSEFIPGSTMLQWPSTAAELGACAQALHCRDCADHSRNPAVGTDPGTSAEIPCLATPESDSDQSRDNGCALEDGYRPLRAEGLRVVSAHEGSVPQRCHAIDVDQDLPSQHEEEPDGSENSPGDGLSGASLRESMLDWKFGGTVVLHELDSMESHLEPYVSSQCTPGMGVADRGALTRSDSLIVLPSNKPCGSGVPHTRICSSRMGPSSVLRFCPAW